MIVAGFGFRGAATEDSLRDAYDRARSGQGAILLATADDKADSPAFRALAARLGLPVHPVSEKALCAQTTITRSDVSLAVRDTGSLAEACALAGAGIGASLLGFRTISEDRMATCALAEGEFT